jgi:hypothetical protein
MMREGKITRHGFIYNVGNRNPCVSVKGENAESWKALRRTTIPGKSVKISKYPTE